MWATPPIGVLPQKKPRRVNNLPGLFGLYFHCTPPNIPCAIGYGLCQECHEFKNI